MSSLIFLAVWLIVVLGVAWYSVANQHSSPVRSNAGFALVGSLSLAFINGPGWVVFLIGLLSGQDLSEFSVEGARAAFWPALLAVVLAGLCLSFYAIKRTPLSHFAAREGDLKLRTRRACLWLIIGCFLVLPMTSYVALTLNYDTYEFNRLRDATGVGIGSAYEILFMYFLVPYLAMMWLPFAVLDLAYSKLILQSDLGRPAALVVLAATLMSYSMPYMLMLYVLAFDLMEMDFPGTGLGSSVSITYYNYFLVLAPPIGALLALPWFFGTRFVLRRRTGRS